MDLSKKDDYYERHSKIAIDKALQEAKGRDLEMTRYLLRRSYPFSLPRQRCPGYKIWSRQVLEVEARLGIGARKHNKRNGRAINFED